MAQTRPVQLNITQPPLSPDDSGWTWIAPSLVVEAAKTTEEQDSLFSELMQKADDRADQLRKRAKKAREQAERRGKEWLVTSV